MIVFKGNAERKNILKDSLFCEKTIQLIEYIQEEFRDRIQFSDWMDEFSKLQVLAKVLDLEN